LSTLFCAFMFPYWSISHPEDTFTINLTLPVVNASLYIVSHIHVVLFWTMCHSVGINSHFILSLVSYFRSTHHVS
uniref:Ovule protein n=1 Tax=Brugia timori TaxID=42155 RepID=A0A0R3Q8D3_9BILA